MVTKKLIFLALILILTGIILVSYISKLQSVPFFVDEYHFLRKAYYFNLFFVDNDRSNAKFYTEFEAAQPKIGIYIYGATLYLYGVKDVNTFLSRFEIKSWPKSVGPLMTSFGGTKLSNFPSHMNDFVKVIFNQRKVSLFFTFLSFVLIFLICSKVMGYLYAFLTTYLVSSNTLVVYTNSVATTDSMLMFFTFLCFFVTIKLTEALKNNSKKIYQYSFLLGICMAFAAGVKVTGIVIVFYALCFLAVSIWSSWNDIVKRAAILKGLLVTIVSFFVVFVYFHPFLYKETLENFILMFVGRYKGIADAQLQNTVADVPTRVQALKLILKETLLPGGLYTNFELGYVPIDLVLFLFGATLLIKNLFQKYKFFGQPPLEAMVLILFLLTLSALVMYLKVNWPRYFMQTEILISMVQCYGLAIFLAWYRKLMVKLF